MFDELKNCSCMSDIVNWKKEFDKLDEDTKMEIEKEIKRVYKMTCEMYYYLKMREFGQYPNMLN